MYIKEITYKDYDDVERTEKFYFNLTKAELIESELTTVGGLENEIRRIVEAKDMPSIIKIFKRLILQAYGIKSDDGRRFMKSEEISRSFAETEAYSELFTELASNTEAAIAFVNGILPKELLEEAKNKNIDLTSVEGAMNSIEKVEG